MKDQQFPIYNTQSSPTAMNRRTFMYGAGLLSMSLIHAQSFAALATFGLRVVRQENWETLMNRNVCIPSEIYSTTPNQLICYGLELPYRSNNQNISAIPEGVYDAYARKSKKNGPVIELLGVPNREYVQFHSGNSVDDTLGCVIFGSNPVTSAPTENPPPYLKHTKQCWIPSSVKARNQVLDLYGWRDRAATPPTRPIKVSIESV